MFVFLVVLFVILIFICFFRGVFVFDFVRERTFLFIYVTYFSKEVRKVREKETIIILLFLYLYWSPIFLSSHFPIFPLYYLRCAFSIFGMI